jgi:hypothetical protein
LTAKARAAGRAAVQERARNRALDLAPTIKELQEAGCESLPAWICPRSSTENYHGALGDGPTATAGRGSIERNDMALT